MMSLSKLLEKIVGKLLHLYYTILLHEFLMFSCLFISQWLMKFNYIHTFSLIFENKVERIHVLFDVWIRKIKTNTQGSTQVVTAYSNKDRFIFKESKE